MGVIAYVIGECMRIIRRFGNKYVSCFIMLVALIAITYYCIFSSVNVEEIQTTIQSSEFKYIMIGILAMFLNICLEGVSIHIIGQSLGICIGRIRSFCYACIDLYYCGITPSAAGGQPVLAYYMSRDNIPISKSTIIVLLYTVMYKIVLLFLGVVVLTLHLDFIMENRLTLFLFVIGMVVNLVIVALCLLCMYSRTVVRQIVSKVIFFLHKLHIIKNKEKKIDSFHKHIEEYHSSAIFIKENKLVLVKVFLVTLLQRLVLFSVGYLVYFSFGLSNFHFLDILAIQVVIAIMVDSLPLPGAVGISEAMLFLLYTKVYAPEFIAPAMVLTRGINFYLMLILTGVITILYHILSVKPNEVLKGEK